MATGRVQVTFDCADPEALATFWAQVLEYPLPDIEGWHEILRSRGLERDIGKFCRIDDPTGVRPRLFFQRVPEPKTVKNRVHLDVSVGLDPRDTHRARVDAEVERVIALGATKQRPVDDDSYYVVMQDPEANEFCID